MIRTSFLSILVGLVTSLESYGDFTTAQAASLVLGQQNFTSSTQITSQVGLVSPSDVAIDPATGKVFVVDYSSRRVVRYTAFPSLQNGAPAEAVLGQDGFTSSIQGTAQNRMKGPGGICIDFQGRLWVADSGNNRILRFEGASSKSSGAPADGVLGQVIFNTNTANTGNTGMNLPTGVSVDLSGNLWVADQFNRRVICFKQAGLKSNGGSADLVLGQPDFATVTAGISDKKMNSAVKLTISNQDTLWVVDGGNNRVLRFESASSKINGAPANGVLGQTSFVTNGSGTSASQFNGVNSLAIDSLGTLYTGEFTSSRVLSFKNASAKANGAPADGVLGQPDFNTSNQTITAQSTFHVEGVGLDLSGRLYVAQGMAGRVTCYSPVSSVINGTPIITITGKKYPKINNSIYTLKGRAFSAVGILKIQYHLGSKGGFKAAQGTASWRAKVSKLKLGLNKVTIKAIATNGQIASRLIKIKRTL